MKLNIYVLIACLIPIFSFSQEIKHIKSDIRFKYDFGEEVQKDWKRIEQLFSENKDWDDFSEEDIQLIQKYDAEVVEGMWEVLGGGCSFYCGAGEYTVKTSSNLLDKNGISYVSNNISDFSYRTSWVEGVKGNGIHEYIEFTFSPSHPRITEIIIANGYIKSEALWKNNSRVKSFLMYVNDKKIAVLELKDTYAEQSFEISAVGYSERSDYESLKSKPPFTIRLEILEVYPGEKFEDTAITEIYFDGIDVH